MRTSLRLYLILSGSIFGLVSMLHFLRLLFDLTVVVGPWTIPFGLSYVGFPVAACYGAWGIWLAQR